MLHTAALIAGCASLALISAIYMINVHAPAKSWLRDDMIAMALLSLLTGLFPIAATATLVGMWSLVTGGLSWVAVLAAGADLVGLATVVGTMVVFRALVVATYRNRAAPDNVTPLSPRPVTPRPTGGMMKKAA